MTDCDFDKKWHDTEAPGHSGKHGHYCPEWDYLYICEDCEMEWSCCGCFRTVSPAASSNAPGTAPEAPSGGPSE